jgi:hypothetical protein
MYHKKDLYLTETVRLQSKHKAFRLCGVLAPLPLSATLPLATA